MGVFESANSSPASVMSTGPVIRYTSTANHPKIFKSHISQERTNVFNTMRDVRVRSKSGKGEEEEEEQEHELVTIYWDVSTGNL